MLHGCVCKAMMSIDGQKVPVGRQKAKRLHVFYGGVFYCSL